mgnify:CR=1 FL=1
MTEPPDFWNSLVRGLTVSKEERSLILRSLGWLALLVTFLILF